MIQSVTVRIQERQGVSGIRVALGGPKGDRGDNFQPDATGLLAARGTHDAEAAGFAFLATDTADLYFRETATAGVWSAAVPFGGAGGGGTGDVDGPASSVDGRAALFDGVTGKLLKQSSAAPVLVGDPALTDSRTPTAHAASHGTGGGDAITVAESQVTGLTAALAGKETAGAAAAAVSAHEGASDPHPGYLTPAEGDAAYAALAHVGSGGGAHANAVAAGAAGFLTGADQSKLDGVASGATANAADAALRDRATHTGTQAVGTITGLAAVATSGAYSDLSGTPSLGSAAATASTDYAPAAQGVTNGNSHDHNGGGGAQIAYGSLSGLPSLPTGTNTGDQAVSNTSDATSHTVTLSASGGSVQLVEGANITLTTTGTSGAGVVTIAGTGGGASDLDDLTDVVITTPATDQVLKYNGTNWINGTTAGGGDALVSGTLAQFAETSSDQLRGVISNETGTGALVFADSPALIAPRVSVDATVTAGTNAQGQAPLTADVNVITTTPDNPSGVTLPSATAGRTVAVVNRGTNTINIYPAVGEGIDGFSTDAAFGLGATLQVQLQGTSASNWASSRLQRTDVGTISGAASGMLNFLITPTSANLRNALTDETGTGLAYFQGGDAGTPSAIVLTNGTGLPAAEVTGLGSLATQSAIGSISSSGAIGSTANLPIITGASGVLGVGSFGTTASTFCEGNDSRLSDARTPTAHNQAWSTITSTPTTLSGYGITDAQPSDSDLTSIAALTTTSFGRSFLDRADAAAGRTHLGLGTLSTQSGTFSGTSSGTNTGDQTITLTGDVTGTGTGSFATTVANDAVTYAKIQNVTATDRLLGRSSAGAGDVEEITCTAAGRNLIDDADATAQRTTLGLGTLATQSGTFSGTSSGTNTGDQTITNTSDATSHTVTLSASGGTVQFVEGANVTLTTTGTSGAGVVTIASTASGGGFPAGNISSAGAIGSTANLPIITTTDGVLVAGAFGTAANQFAQGNDSRFDFYMPIALSDVSTAVTTGTGKEEFTVERAFTLHVIPRFTATTAPTGATFLFDVNKNGTTIFDTRPQIDAAGTRSISAGTQAVLTGGSVSYAIGDVIRFDFDQVGSTAAGAGIKAHLFGRWT